MAWHAFYQCRKCNQTYDRFNFFPNEILPCRNPNCGAYNYAYREVSNEKEQKKNV